MIWTPEEQRRGWRLSMTDPAQETPEARAWLDRVETLLNEELRRSWRDLLLDGYVKVPR